MGNYCKFLFNVFPIFSIQTRVKLGLFSNIILTSSMFFSEKAVRAYLIKSLSKCYLNCYVAFSFEHFFNKFVVLVFLVRETCSYFDIWDIVTLNLLQKRYFWLFLWAFCPPSYLIMTFEAHYLCTNSRITSLI